MQEKGSGSILCARLRLSRACDYGFESHRKTRWLILSSTPLLQDWLGDDATKRQRREIHFPSGRFGEAVEQAYAVLYLASDESGYMNGHDMVVDGGMTRVRKNTDRSCTQAYWYRHTLPLKALRWPLRPTLLVEAALRKGIVMTILDKKMMRYAPFGGWSLGARIRR